MTRPGRLVCATCGKEEGPFAGRVVCDCGKSTVRWCARGGGIERTGPFPTQAKAAASLRLVAGGFPDDAFVWPEESTP
jgi:hypothetical protein